MTNLTTPLMRLIVLDLFEAVLLAPEEERETVSKDKDIVEIWSFGPSRV